jgi:hypothetical protein
VFKGLKMMVQIIGEDGCFSRVDYISEKLKKDWKDLTTKEIILEVERLRMEYYRKCGGMAVRGKCKLERSLRFDEMESKELNPNL